MGVTVGAAGAEGWGGLGRAGEGWVPRTRRAPCAVFTSITQSWQEVSAPDQCEFPGYCDRKSCVFPCACSV